MDSSVDWKQLLELLIMKDLPKKQQKVFDVFRKHGIDMMTAMAMLLELSQVFQEEEDATDS